MSRILKGMKNGVRIFGLGSMVNQYGSEVNFTKENSGEHKLNRAMRRKLNKTKQNKTR